MSDETVRVLYVDDNPEDVGIVRRLLSQCGRGSFRVTSVESTAHCLNRLRGEGADLLLLDYSLPGEDGLSFLRRLSTMIGLPPVIMLTGRGDERLAIEALRSGAQDYLAKDSLTPSSLGSCVEQVLERFRHQEELGRFDEQIMVALATAAEGKDSTTGGHLQRLAHSAVRVGQALRLDEHELHVLRYGALLHDIGKLAVRAVVLRKPDPLNEEEWEEIRQHPVVGERICSCLWLARQVGPLIRHHHERWDGTGYVDGLAGEEIPLLARVVSVVDAYDAMSFDRPYRKALTPAQVIGELKSGAGRQWDPDVVDVFLDLLGHGELVPAQIEKRAQRRIASEAANGT